MPFDPDAYLADKSAEKASPKVPTTGFNPDEFLLAKASDKKPFVTTLLPDSLASFFPSEKEAMQMRLAKGLAAKPAEPVAEYSPATEMALGSIAGRPALTVAKNVLTNPMVRRLGLQALKTGGTAAATAIGAGGALKFFGSGH